MGWEHLADVGATTCARTGPVIGHPVPGLEKRRALHIGDRKRELGLANIDRDDDRRVVTGDA
jgi:hypothetical protein